MISNTSFKMVESGIGNNIAWKPKNIRGTLQILKLKKNNTLEQSPTLDSTVFFKKLDKISDRLVKMVGIV